MFSCSQPEATNTILPLCLLADRHLMCYNQFLENSAIVEFLLPRILHGKIQNSGNQGPQNQGSAVYNLIVVQRFCLHCMVTEWNRQKILGVSALLLIKIVLNCKIFPRDRICMLGFAVIKFKEPMCFHTLVKYQNFMKQHCTYSNSGRHKLEIMIFYFNAKNIF